jgi:hypothetical protein
LLAKAEKDWHAIPALKATAVDLCRVQGRHALRPNWQCKRGFHPFVKSIPRQECWVRWLSSPEQCVPHLYQLRSCGLHLRQPPLEFLYTEQHHDYTATIAAPQRPG